MIEEQHFDGAHQELKPGDVIGFYDGPYIGAVVAKVARLTNTRAYYLNKRGRMSYKDKRMVFKIQDQNFV